MNDVELRRVEKDSTHLQCEAIADLATRSSDPKVSSIALQALSALRNLDEPSKLIPEVLFQPLRQQFLRCFYLEHSGETKYQLSAPHAVAERLSRAIMCLPPDVRHGLLDRVNSLVKLSDPKDLRIISLRIFLLKEGVFRRAKKGNLALVYRELVKSVLDLPAQSPGDVDPWIHQRVKELGDTFKIEDDADDQDKHSAISYLLQETSLSDKPLPTIQEELLIRCLHSKWCTPCALKASAVSSFRSQLYAFTNIDAD